MANQQAIDEVRQQITNTFNEMNTDGNDTVSITEFVLFYRAKVSDGGDRGELMHLFNSIDDSNDSKMTLDEFIDWATNLPPKTITACHVEKMFNEHDASGDGVLDRSELLELLKNVNYDGDMCDQIITAIAGEDQMINKKEFIEKWKSEFE